MTGTADIRGERLDILVSSIEYAGNIIPVELATYDIDGQRGIFVPGSESRTAAKEVLGEVSQSMGGSISFAGSAGQQVAMDLTRGVLQGWDTVHLAAGQGGQGKAEGRIQGVAGHKKAITRFNCNF